MKSRCLNILTVILCSFVLFACGTTANVGSKIKKVELGMSKKEVVRILGDSYAPLGAVVTEKGNLETVRYTSTWTDEYYFVNFLDGRLVEWFVEPVVRDEQGRAVN